MYLKHPLVLKEFIDGTGERQRAIPAVRGLPMVFLV
jgi:hypothetical protein